MGTECFVQALPTGTISMTLLEKATGTVDGNENAGTADRRKSWYS